MASSRFNRRAFFQSALTGGGALNAVAAPAADGAFFDAPAEKLELHDDADVIICGAGSAGIAAAITAARAGARTRLFEVHGCLGGV